MYSTVTQTEQIAQAQAEFEQRVIKEASQSGELKLGYQGGGRELTVNFFRSFNLWVGCAEDRNRYWNAFGLGNPFKESHSIIAEINAPHQGINRRIAGAFVQKGDGTIWLAHRGGIGGGRQGIGKKGFLNWYPEPMDSVYDGDRVTQMIVIGNCTDAGLFERLGHFTELVYSFKQTFVNS